MKLDASSSTLRALLISPGAVLFSLRSKLLRLQTEMPCARTDQFNEFLLRFLYVSNKFHYLFRDFALSCFRDKRYPSFPL